MPTRPWRWRKPCSAPPRRPRPARASPASPAAAGNGPGGRAADAPARRGPRGRPFAPAMETRIRILAPEALPAVFPGMAPAGPCPAWPGCWSAPPMAPACRAAGAGRAATRAAPAGVMVPPEHAGGTAVIFRLTIPAATPACAGRGRLAARTRFARVTPGASARWSMAMMPARAGHRRRACASVNAWNGCRLRLRPQPHVGRGSACVTPWPATEPASRCPPIPAPAEAARQGRGVRWPRPAGPSVSALPGCVPVVGGRYRFRGRWTARWRDGPRRGRIAHVLRCRHRASLRTYYAPGRAERLDRSMRASWRKMASPSTSARMWGNRTASFPPLGARVVAWSHSRG